MAVTTISSLPAPVQQWFDKVLLSRPMPMLVHGLFAVKKQLPAEGGRTMRFRRYNNLATAPVPLSANGLPPAPETLTAVDIDATINWYGQYVTITDQVTFVNQDPVLNETASLLAQSMRETEDQLIRDMLAATASQVNCTQGGGADNPTPLSLGDITDAFVALLNNSAMMISDNIEGDLKFGTAPVREAFWSMSPVQVIPDLEAVTGFIPRAQYPAVMNTLSQEWGSVENVRFVVTQVGSVLPGGSALGNDVYRNFITGREAYAKIDLTEASASFIYKPLGWGNDPLNQKQTAGWKFAQAYRILNDQWILSLNCTLG